MTPAICVQISMLSPQRPALTSGRRSCATARGAGSQKCRCHLGVVGSGTQPVHRACTVAREARIARAEFSLRARILRLPLAAGFSLQHWQIAVHFWLRACKRASLHGRRSATTTWPSAEP